ncbi:hypothetical protein SAMN05216282_104203 [Cryobacterium psychrotolerans]|uniref:Prepilin-type N-terminal cleavage/methylation domain-containing protein n=1 Tax=Cryobacterium psychrotolerans TaxID=386301 RepID=A0A1G9APD9_9MICO|nr:MULTISPECIES: hypothetical protein [Cryobacterium]TFD42720.1 hypothetical protein E3T33_11680 [Cryobacterium sp. TMT1-2-1]TFD89575.1 hypothetical protein E3T56_02530 [Cryobacterium psychrotolerans]SDK29229.1 hypothetical protein SAMN05216282_104203 [Cryobacterium psychrotolerans]
MPSRSGVSGRESAEVGFSLIELLIYMVLAVVVLLVVGSLLINSLTAERTVRDAAQSSSTGQLVSKSVGQGVRNSSSIWRSPAGAVPQVLIVRTAGTASTESWFCQAWSFQNGQIRSTSSPDLIPTTTANIATWTLIGDGMAPVAGFPVFGGSGRTVVLKLDVDSGKGQPLRIETSLHSRQPVPATGVEVSLPCF